MRSLRTGLTVGNGVIVVVLLGAFGFAQIATNQSRMRAALDDDLRRQALDAARSGPPRDRRPEFGLVPPPPMPTDERSPGQPGLGDGPPPPPDPYRDVRRLADIRRPRFFAAERDSMAAADVALDTVALRQAMQGVPTISNVPYEGRPIRVFTAPIRRQGEIVGAVQMARELGGLDESWASQVGTLLLLLPVALLAAVAGAKLLTDRALKPVAKMTSAAAEISHTDLARRLDVVGDDEFGRLAGTFNEMLARLDRSFRDLQKTVDDLERAYENQRRFTADASHELRTPLTRLRLATSTALAGARTPEELRDALETADKAAATMTRLTQQLLLLAKADSGQLGLRLQPIDLRVVVAEALDPYDEERLEATFADRPVMAAGDAEHLARVVTNLVDNALRYAPNGPVRVRVANEGNEAVVSVIDEGEGIACEHLGHLGERFYRVDTARSRKDGGSGLGLAISKNIVAGHGGRLEIESAVGRGTTVRVFLPSPPGSDEGLTKPSRSVNRVNLESREEAAKEER